MSAATETANEKMLLSVIETLQKSNAQLTGLLESCMKDMKTTTTHDVAIPMMIQKAEPAPAPEVAEAAPEPEPETAAQETADDSAGKKRRVRKPLTDEQKAALKAKRQERKKQKMEKEDEIKTTDEFAFTGPAAAATSE